MPVQKSIALARTTVTAAATEHLRKEIVCGSLQPGETLAESQVGQMLGVSRAPVREALSLLEREGLVEFDRRGTARVCEFDREAVRELFQAIRSGLPDKAEALARQHTTHWLSEFIQSKAFAPQPKE